jgi:uncharacterized glyoxalase superfamily protein PhnB
MTIKNGTPEGHHTITPHVVVKGAAKAIEFYAKAFGAEEISRLGMPGGLVAHAELRIGDSILWLADENPQMGAFAQAAPGAVTIHLFVKDADAVFAKAVAAGAKVALPLTDMFWGSRYGQVVDGFGLKWSIATQVREVSPQEMAAAMQKMAG